jgi:1-deoxy-D-xylulose-5-phosphate reductoisomerase
MVARRTVSVFGSTGSIGRSTLDVIASHGGPDAYDVRVVAGGSNVALLAEQARAVHADRAVIQDESKLADLRAALAETGIDTAAGDSALVDAASERVDLCVSAIAGAAGLYPTLAAIRAGSHIALANKESMVCAGDLVRSEAQRMGVRILPVDSEHNAIFQVLEAHHAAAIERIILTASGGPFRDWPLERMRAVTPEEAIAHPNWSMGVAISLDSATMFNKGLELIEADQLFPVAHHHIEILVHPQSIIHSMVGYTDGSILAQLGTPDMRTPIAYALGWPARVTAPVERLDFAALASIDFEAPDETRFPALRIAREALEVGGLAPCAMNAAKEVAAEAFLMRDITFLEIASVVEHVLEAFENGAAARSLDEVIAADGEARRLARLAVRSRTRRTA